MRITPLDVRKQEFRRGMRGLDPDEVYAFLATVAEEYETVLNENKALRERLLELDDKVQEYRTMEKTLRDTLMTAERVTVETKENARREATIIVKEAQIEAEKALRDISNESIKLGQQVSYLRSQRDAYLAKMKLVADSHLDFIKTAFSDFASDDAVVDEHAPMATPSPKPIAPASAAPQEKKLFEATPAAPVVPDAAVPGAAAPAAPQGTPTTEKSSVTPPTSAPVTTPPMGDVVPKAVDATPPGDGGSISDISAIIDRMRTNETVPSDGAWKQIVDEPAPSAQTAVATPPPIAPVVTPSPVVAPSATDVTSEFNLDEIKREIGSGLAKDSDSR